MRTILSGIHFLVISTETSFLRQIKNKLKEKEKAEVFLATSLLQAKQILETESLHVVLFDYDLASIEDALDFLSLFQEYSAGGYFYTKKPNYKEALEIIKAGAHRFYQSYDSGIAAQFTDTKAPSFLSLKACIARATISLPVPDSPIIKTE